MKMIHTPGWVEEQCCIIEIVIPYPEKRLNWVNNLVGVLAIFEALKEIGMEDRGEH